MNPNLVAKIQAPDTKGKSSIGTGYPISHEWVITARHVVDFSDKSSAPIMLEWPTLQPVTVTGVELLDNDIALLRCDVPAELGNIVFSPAVKFPTERVGWKSAGYPDVNECKWFDATGIFGADSGKALIALTLDDTARKDEWGDMSGAPVFSGDKFCAVIVTHDQRMGKRLNAVSIPWLLKHDPAFRQLLEPVKQAAIHALTIKLHHRLRQEIERIFHYRNIPLDKLREALQQPADASLQEIVAYLVEQCETRQGLALLAGMALHLETEWRDSHQDAWSIYLRDMEQVCGWLLLKSVSPEWWLQNEARLQQRVGRNITSTFTLELPAYIEVIISRSLLQPARYTLDKHNKIKPFGESHDVLLFDALAYGAKDIELLTPIYKDLYRINSVPDYSDINDLLDDIEDAAIPLRDARGGKVIYYLVSKDYLSLLQDTHWFDSAKRQLAGCVQFVCCEQQGDSDDVPPCEDRQKSLLGQLATILRLRKPKETLHV